MSDQKIKGGAGPALAAHSKDGSAPGPTPASSATGNDAKPSAEASGKAGEALEAATNARQEISSATSRMLDETAAFTREQPLMALAFMGVIGLAVGMLLGRR